MKKVFSFLLITFISLSLMFIILPIKKLEANGPICTITITPGYPTTIDLHFENCIGLNYECEADYVGDIDSNLKDVHIERYYGPGQHTAYLYVFKNNGDPDIKIYIAGEDDLVCYKTVTFTVPEYEKQDKPWVRTMPMTCWQVWINEDNNFQFIFWYPYKDKNWVRIYDMEGNMVYEIDIPLDDPNLIVDLPDGFYTVKTFHGEELLQEFLIGKP